MNASETEARPQSLRDMQELVTVKQVAQCTQLSKGMIYKMIKNGDLQAVRVRGTTLRLRRDDVCAFFGL